MMEIYDTLPTPLGDLLLVAAGDGLTGVYFETFRHGRRIEAGWRLASAHAGPESAVLADARAQLAAYFAGTLRAFTLPLRPRGTPFQLRVWDTLRDVAFGEAVSYTELARRVGSPQAVRAVGGANARNPLSVIVPCHRVVGADGRLTGYGGGIDRKRWLLRHEGGGGVADTLQLALGPHG